MVHDELEKYSEWVVTEYQKIRAPQIEANLARQAGIPRLLFS